jgi:hypothetical protein
MADDPRDHDEDHRPPRRPGPDDEDRPAPGVATSHKLLVAVGGLALLGCCGLGGCLALVAAGSRWAADREAREVAGGPAVAIDADALYGEFDANGVAADMKYKGKVLEVTGTIKAIEKPLYGGPQVELGSAKYEFRSTVDCEFPDSALVALANLRKGQRLTIRGRYKGFGVSVLLDHCVLK